MGKMGKKLTDRELIESVLAWYKLDQPTEVLREKVAAYVDQNEELERAVTDENSSESISASAFEARFDSSNRESKEATYKPQFEPTDELIGTRGWRIDVWALYYGMEDFLQRISFGLVSMQSLAVLACILISAAVMIGAWQSTLSTERQKKATFKSMDIESAEKTRKKILTLEPNAPSDSVDLRTSSGSTNSASDDTEPPVVEPISIAASPIQIAETEFGSVLQLMEKAEWNEALSDLRTLEDSGRAELQPLLTLLKVEVLIQKRDSVSMELARQLLMDCKPAELTTVYDLLVARWMLLGSTEDRKRFLNEVVSLPDTARRRMSLWANIRNGSTDAMTEVLLDTNAAKGPSKVCDQLFIASFHFNIGKYDDTLRELLDTQQRLRDLKPSGNSPAESWLLDFAKVQLAARVEEILSFVTLKMRETIN